MIQNFATVVIYESWCRKFEYVSDFFVVFDPAGVSSRLSNDEVHGLLNLESRKASRGFLYSLTPRKDCFKFWWNISRFIIFLYFQPYPISNSNPSLLPSKPSCKSFLPVNTEHKLLSGTESVKLNTLSYISY